MRFKAKKIKEGSKRAVALYMVLTLLFEIAFPSVSMALTSGPSQPEVESFEPVGTSQMVDPFSGDFNYNIPLLDVDGYPVNISYHSGITTDQEASWVGLGWNINPGVINRGMRGLPDDFNGEAVVKEYNMKKNKTFGVNFGLGLEFFGADAAALAGVSYDLAVHYNTYNGLGASQTIAGHLPLGEPGKTPCTASFGITSSSDNGLTIQPTLNFSEKMEKADAQSSKLGLSIGTAFNSRAGLQQLTIGVSRAKPFQARKNPLNINGGRSSSFNLGMPTYTPEFTLPFSNFSLSASFKLGGEIFGAFVNGKIGGYYSSQTLAQTTLSCPAYGYLNADEGVKYDNSLMDFNREKDGAFSPSTVALAIPNFTYDLLNVSGQGVGGSYRPFRSDFGQVFDPIVHNTSASGSIGVELGLGETFKLGVDVSVSDVNSQSGRWSNNDGSNGAYNTNFFTQSSSNPTYEKYYYKEANEKSVDADPTFLQRAGNYSPERYELFQNSEFNTEVTSSFASGGGASGTRGAREKRNQVISMLSRGEMNDYGLTVDPNLYSSAKSYHTAEVTSLTPDGRRYVYGIAAYNTRQEETTFAIGKDEFNNGGSHLSSLNCTTGLISYSPGSNNSTSNTDGVDNYYSNTIMPAYAHSYLLTAVLSADYVDVDGVQGPSANDLGTYTKFNYTKAYGNFKWRTPFDQNKASYNEGLKWTDQDDKASYVYGEKEIWYLSSIETKNCIAVFSTENRQDGFGVTDKNGGINTSQPLKLLRKISLYTKVNYDAHAANSSVALIPIKEVHFTYDYSLCPGVPNNSTAGNGKLTLKEISFSYQSSSKARLSPYKFVYGYNPSYNVKAYDRWGTYKPEDPTVNCDTATANTALSNAEYPYTPQDTSADRFAAAWALDTVKLPSGGAINIDYESDDYAYVQNKRAGQMFKVVGLSSDTASWVSISNTSPNLESGYMVIELQDQLTGSNLKEQFRKLYLDGLDYMYFRFLYHMSGSKYEFVLGYVPTSSIAKYGVYSGGTHAYLKFTSLKTNDNGTGSFVCPITKAALQFGRLNEPKNMYGPAGINSNSSFGKSLLQAFAASSFVKNVKTTMKGPNDALYSTLYNCCQYFVFSKSWIRLNNPNMHKKGGGSRVKKIEIADQWNTMTSAAMSGFSYGQEYTYNNDDGSSSGVACYEPQLGGDENSLHTPVFFDITHLLAPNDKMYQEEPFGESFFPSPSVGYGQVTVQNIKYTGVVRHATGKIVHEFYTAKDFPTITLQTGLQAIRERTDPLSLSSFLHIDIKDYMTASQGFYVELNDMHGKEKGQEVYQEGISTPISSVEYIYQSNNYQNGSFRLNNTVQTISPTGTAGLNDVGVFFDFVTDFREQKSSTISGSLNYNNDAFWVIVGVIDIPTIWPGFASDKTQFRSAVSTKVVQRFGLLEKTIAKDLGSTVETQNLAYDSETGNVLLAQTITDYNDPVYNMNYPAYWYYDGMGPAYKNIGVGFNAVSFSTGNATIANASSYFAPGDEIEMNGTSSRKGWVLSVGTNSITVEDTIGNKPAGIYNIKVIRSGRRNMQSEQMASLTSLKNPLNAINNNAYENVITASGTEFNDSWNIFCDCSSSYVGLDPSASYVTGSKGNWRKKRSFAYLTGRTQSNYDNNTNTRKDGVYTSYNPLYKKTGSKWQLDTTNWTFTSKVTIINPHGQEIENQDPLGRYSSATYGYNQAFPTIVAANTRYRELAYDNFEDYGSANCGDKHFKFGSPTLDNTKAHTGRNSVRVSAGTPLEMMKVLQTNVCDNPDPCQIIMTQSGDPNSPAPVYNFSGGGAASPITLSYVVTNGTPPVTVSGGVLTVNGGRSYSPSWSIDVTVTGANGCTKTFSIGNVNN